MKKRSGIISVLLVSFLIIWNVFLQFQLWAVEQKIENNNGTPTSEKGPSTTGNINIESDITKVVDKVKGKVVSILIVDNQGRTIGSGSGVIYKNENGIISVITNHHVIESGQNIIVRTFDGNEYKAKLVGSDVYTDLALLKFEAELDIEPFELGDSSNVNVGEYVLTMGSPIGVEFENSVTFGIISGKDRLVEVDINGDGIGDWDMLVLQTDAAINPGNSGGALINMAGQLIGINSMKISSDKIEGMGFAIPINEVVPVIEQLEKDGKVNYPTLGISAVAIEDLNQYQKAYYNVKDLENGVLISDIMENSAASVSGLKTGDVIVKFGGENISSFKQFRQLLYKQKSGDSITLEIYRDGELMTVEAKLQ